MTATSTRGSARALRVVVAGCAALSLILVAWPSRGAQAFSLLVYQQSEFPGQFSADAIAYVRLVHAVLGAVMAAWFVTLYLIAPFLACDRRLSGALACAILVWFVPDTAYSLWSGFWENAVLNTVIALLLITPLAVVRPNGSSWTPPADEPVSSPD